MATPSTPSDKNEEINSRSSTPLVGQPSDPPIIVSQTRLVNTMLIGPQHVNELGMCRGGEVLSWVDVTAGLASSRVANTDCVTASVDAVHFLKPCFPGDILIISAMVNRAFRTSMEVGVRVEGVSLHTGERRYCCSAYLTFVALGPNGKGVPVREVTPVSTAEQRRHGEAEQRRRKRLEEKTHVAMPPLSLGSAGLDVHQQAVRRASFTSSLADTTTRMVFKVFPQHANSLGVTFGGQIMAWMEESAYVSASRYARLGTMVLASVDSLSFLGPTRIGDIVHVVAQVTGCFSHSVEVYCSVYRSPKDARFEMQHCNSGFMTFVAMDKATRHPCPVPQAVASTPMEGELQKQAQARKAAREAAVAKLTRPENDVTGKLARLNSMGPASFDPL